MKTWNPPSILGDDVNNIRSSNTVKVPERKIILKSMENVEKNIGEEILNILRNLRVEVNPDEFNNARNKFPYFDKISPEIFAFALLFIKKGWNFKRDEDNIVSVVSGNIKSNPKIFPQLSKILDEDGEVSGALLLDIKRYMDRINN